MIGLELPKLPFLITEKGQKKVVTAKSAGLQPIKARKLAGKVTPAIAEAPTKRRAHHKELLILWFNCCRSVPFIIATEPSQLYSNR